PGSSVMFWAANKHLIASLQSENAQLNARCETLGASLALLNEELAREREKSAQQLARQDMIVGVVANLPSFNASLQSIQTSLQGLSVNLHENRSAAAEVAAQADANGASFERTTQNLETMCERISSAGKTVGDLALRAGEIGGIVQLMKEIAAQTNLLALKAE